MTAIFSPIYEVTIQLWVHKITLVVDTGAAVPILLKKYLKNTVLYPTNISLLSANNVNVKCPGQIVHTLTISNHRINFKRKCIVVNSTKVDSHNFL